MTHSTNSDASFLLKVRRLEAHRATVDYSYLVSIHDAVTVSGTIVVTSSTIPPVSAPAHPVEEIPGVLVVAHFKDYPQKPVENVIENTILILDQLVSEAKSKFGVA